MDHYLFQLINGLAGQIFWLDSLAIFSAKYLGYILAILVFLIFWKKWKIIFQVFLAAILARLVIVEIIRWLWEKPRPFVENGFDALTTSQVNLFLEHSQSPAFPSGHAAFFFALSVVVYFYNKKAGLVFLVASFLISLARIFTGVHWPSDIIAGAIVGIFSGWLVVRISKKLF